MTIDFAQLSRGAGRLFAALAIIASPAAWAGVDWTVNNTDTGFDPAPAGGNITYTVRIDNGGTIDAPATTLTLTIPSTTTFVSASGMTCTGTGPVNCTVPPLAAGANATVLVTIKTSVAGTVTLGATIPALDDIAANNTKNEPTTVNAGSDIALALSGPASAQSGSTVFYTFTATNNGPDASGNQTLSFPVPTGLVNITPPGGCSLSGTTYSCTVAGLAVGASTPLVFSGQIASASGSTLSPVGSIAQATGPLDPITANNTTTFNTTVTAGSDVRIAKARAPGGTLLVGQAVTFTLTPSYTGDSPSGLTITDTLPANYTIGAVASPQNGWTCGVAGQTVTCTKAAGSGAGSNVSLGNIVIPVMVANAVGSPVTNTTSIGTTSSDPNPANNSANDGGASIQTPTVDLRANKSGPSPALVVVGNPYIYNISATNLGNAAFFGTLVMTDNLPTGLTVTSYTLNGWSCSPAAPVVGPATITCTRVYTVGLPLAAGATTPAITLNTTATGTGSIINSMTVSSPDANITDTNPGNDTVTYGVTGSTGPNSADIGVTKTASGTVAAGDVLTYTITVTNAGLQTATNVALTDSLTQLINSASGATGAGFVSVVSSGGTVCTHSPAGTTGRNLSCTIASLAFGASETVTVQVRPGGNGGSRSNTATAISHDTADPNLNNNSATVTSPVDPRADVTVSKIATPQPVSAGQNLTYVVAATNIANGLSAAANVTITDTLPNNLTFVSAAPSSGSCATTPTPNSTTGGGNNQVICNFGTLNNGTQRTATIIVRPNTATRGTTVTNNVVVSTSTTEANLAGTDPTLNNSASANTTVNNPALDLLINKIDSVDPVAVGDNTVYTITITNQGPSAAENVVITDTLPPTRLSFQSNTVPAGGSCPTVPAVGSTGSTLKCQIPYLAAGQSRNFTVTMQGVAKGVTTNAASVASDESVAGFDSNSANNAVSETTTVRTKADVQVVSKTPSVTPINLRDDFNFVVKVRNNTGAGLAEADNVVVSDTLPTGMELTGTPTVAILAGSTTATTCTGVAGGTSFSCNLGTVSSGGEVNITLPVQLVTVTSNPQIFTNTASVSTSSLDTVPANNSNSGTVTVNSSSLAGRVFRDFNNDGLVTVGDTGIAGITMTLSGTSFDGATINRTVATDASGNYSFANIPQGTYSITEGAVAEVYLNDGIDTAGTAGGNTAVNDTISAINLPSSTAATGYNFAELPQARIGIAKQVSAGPTNNADGTFNVTFSLVVKNFSLETLNNVTVTDPLAGVAPLFGMYNAGALGSGEYKVVSAPAGTCAGTQAGFTGSGGSTTVAITPSLAAGASCTITFALQIKPTAPLPPVSGLCGARYCNQASVTGEGALSGQTSVTNPQLQDSSDNGANPDPNGNGQANEAGENDPTPVAPAFSAAIGIAKQINGNVSVQPDGSLLVPIRLVVTNVGNEPLDNVSISDPLASGAGGQFGNYVAGGPAAALAGGQYTVQTGPTFSGACSTGATVSSFTGDSGNLSLATITTMATTASCTVDFTFRFLPATLTTLTNQAQASGTGSYTGTPANDLSDDGANPDPNSNGNANEADENDPTPVPIPRIGAAKQAGGVVDNGDGTYSVPFTLTARNYGQMPLSNVQITDVVAGVLPQFGTYTASAVPAAGHYTIASGPTVGAQTNGAALTAVAAGIFTGDGAGTALLVAGSSSLPNFGASASSAQITFTVRFFPTTQGPFNNNAVAAGSPPGGGTVTDNSVAGGNPDLNGNGDPTDDVSPTVVSLEAQSIGVAKQVGGIVQTGPKRYRIPFSLVVENVSATVTATNVQVTDNLAITFPTAQTIAIAVAPAVSACTVTLLSSNPAFTGTGGQTNLLMGNQNLLPGEHCTITFTTEIDFGSNPLPTDAQNNQAVATTAQTAGGTVIATDLSDDGSVPDANGSGNANEAGENDPTPVRFAGAGLSSVSGTVYIDLNRNNAKEATPSDGRIGGVTLNLYQGVSCTGTPVATTTTGSDGAYIFSTVSVGLGYAICETQPLGYGDAAVNPGTGATTPGSNLIAIATLASTGSAGNDFGEIIGSISGAVYRDFGAPAPAVRNNGIQEAGERGIANVPVTLLGTDVAGASVSLTVNTDATGAYVFDNLLPPNASGYTISEGVIPAASGSYSDGKDTAGNATVAAGNATALNDRISGIRMAGGENATGYNFGELEPPVIPTTFPDLVVTKTTPSERITEGQVLNYILLVKNIGPVASAGSYTVTDNLPATTGTPPKWTLESAAGTGWTCAITADKLAVSCSHSTVLQPGELNPSAIALSVKVGVGAAAFGPLRNTVQVSGGGEPDDKKPQPDELSSPQVCGTNPEFNVCQLTVPVQKAAGLSGHVWMDSGTAKVLDSGDQRLPQWIVEVYDISAPSSIGKTFTELVRSGGAARTTTTDSQGYYEVCGLEPNSIYRVLFRDPVNRIAFPGVVTNEQGSVTGADYFSQIKERDGFQVLEVKLPASNGGPGCGGQGIAAPEQSLPLDPNGVVYDAITRAPVAGAKVTLLPEGACTGYNPQLHVINYETYAKDAQGNPVMTTGDDGFYKFLLSGDPSAPQSCQFRFAVEAPAGYKPAPSTVIPPQPLLLTPAAPGIFNVQPQRSPPAGNEDTSYHLLLNLGLAHQEVFNNHIPLDPLQPGNIVLTKQGDKRLVELGDTVLYTVTVRLLEGNPVGQVTVRDRLPTGFTLVRGTVRVNNMLVSDPLGGLGPVLGINLGPLQPNVETKVTYRVRVGVGSLQGDGINRAQAHACQQLAGCLDATGLQPLLGSVNSNEGQFKVEITGGVFTDDACLLGKVFVDCNNNHIQDAEELGIPGVRLYLETGQFMVTDSEGKYNRCGLTPRSHVLTADPSTLPRGSVLTTTSNRNLGNANSLLIDLKNGELHRGDFAEGSCSNPVLEQVKARRSQGEVRSVETEQPPGPALRFESKPLGTPQQGTDSANQPLVQPRQGASDAR